MAKLKIITTDTSRGEKLLRRISQPVKRLGAGIDTLVLGMLHVISQEGTEGVGLSAIQVGEPVRVMVIDLSLWKINKTYTFINPMVVERSKKQVLRQESCLSIESTLDKKDDKGNVIRKGERVGVWRSHRVRVRYTEPGGKQRTRWLGVKASWVFQHELDHFNGVLITDHLPKVVKGEIVRAA